MRNLIKALLLAILRSPVLSDERLSDEQRDRLARNIATVMNSAHVAVPEVDAALDSTEMILHNSGVDPGQSWLVLRDLVSIAEELRPEQPHLLKSAS